MLRPLHCIPLFAAALTLAACQPSSNQQSTTQNNSDHSQSNVSTQLNIDTEQTPNTSWQGRYTGLLPCADCAGIRTTIELDDDKSFEMIEQYMGKGYMAPSKIEGNFHFDPDQPNVIELKSKDMQRKFALGEQTLEALAVEDGSALGELYTLYKLSELPDQSNIKDLELSAYHIQPNGKNDQLHHYYIEIENEGTAPIELKQSQFKLQDDQGKIYEAKYVDPELTTRLSPNQAISGEVHFNYTNAKIVLFKVNP